LFTLAFSRRRVSALALWLTLFPSCDAIAVDQCAALHRFQDARGGAVVGAEKEVSRFAVDRAEQAALSVRAGLLQDQCPHGDHVTYARSSLPGHEAELRIVHTAVVPAEPVDTVGHQCAPSMIETWRGSTGFST
jgi:hypothetical protein